MHPHAALITVLATVLFGYTVFLVGRARGLYTVHAPATSGHPDFDRVFRAHMNTLEQLPVFLPVLWLASLWFDPQYAAWLGYAWLVGRLWYVVGYVKEARLRSPGFLLGALAQLGLTLMALWGIGRALLAA